MRIEDNLGKYAKKGSTPWNKGKHPEYLQGQNHPNWKEKIKKICECEKLFFVPPSRKMRRYCSYKCSWLNKKGKTAWNKGLSLPQFTGKNHGLWKGDKVSYSGLHSWVRRILGKATKCMNDISHKSTRYHWANISGKYYRDLSDFRQLCPSCNLKEGRRYLRN